jgi:hypothetical protein
MVWLRDEVWYGSCLASHCKKFIVFVLGQITVCILPAIAKEYANVKALFGSESSQNHRYCFKCISADGSWKGIGGVGMGVTLCNSRGTGVLGAHHSLRLNIL